MYLLNICICFCLYVYICRHLYIHKYFIYINVSMSTEKYIHRYVDIKIYLYLNSIGPTWINMVQQSLTFGVVNIPNIFNLAHSLEAMLQSKPDLFAKTQIRIVSSFLSDGFAHLSCKMIWFPARIRMHNSYGNPGLPYPQSWRQTKWSWNPQWPGFGRNCTSLAGCGAHAGGAFYRAGAVQCTRNKCGKYAAWRVRATDLGRQFPPLRPTHPYLGMYDSETMR